MACAPNDKLLREALDISLGYFNCGVRGSRELTKLLKRSEKWCEQYYRGYKYYGARRPTELLRGHPDLFNLSVEPHLRLQTRKELRVASGIVQPSRIRIILHYHQPRLSLFPGSIDPAMATDEEMEEIINVRPGRQCKEKPTMRVDVATLRNSRVVGALPDFIAQLARANLELETEAAEQDRANQFELDEASAAIQPHIEMNLLAGLVQRRPGNPTVILPGEQQSDDGANSDSASSSSSSSRSSTSSDSGSPAPSGISAARKPRRTQSTMPPASQTPSPLPSSQPASERPRAASPDSASGSDGDDESSAYSSSSNSVRVKSESMPARSRRIVKLRGPNPEVSPSTSGASGSRPAPSWSEAADRPSSSSATSSSGVGNRLVRKRADSEDGDELRADRAKKLKIEELD